MPTIADLYRGAPESAATIDKVPGQSQLDAYLSGIEAAYGQAGLAISVDGAEVCPGITEDDGTFKIYQRGHGGTDTARTAFHASDPEKLQVVEGIVLISLGRVARSLFQVSEDGGKTYDAFLFSKRAWNNLIGLITDRSGSFEAGDRDSVIPYPSSLSPDPSSQLQINL